MTVAMGNMLMNMNRLSAPAMTYDQGWSMPGWTMFSEMIDGDKLMMMKYSGAMWRSTLK
ncbi:MAG: hypothetical protein U5J63_14715 [Fodinibius sp.]|nr:hypothetical protein [Fodinibius sp.]